MTCLRTATFGSRGEISKFLGFTRALPNIPPMLETKLIHAAQPESKRLMIVLHGLGDSMAGYAWVPQVMPFPWLNYLLVNAPDEYFGGFSWYEYDGDAKTGVRRSIQLLSGLLDQQRQLDFPTEQTILFGFSQGCLMTLETGLRYPHLFAGLIGLSGYVLDPQTLLREASPAAKQQRVLATHGRQDPLIPFADVKKQMEQLKTGGIPIEWHEFDKPHTIIEEEIVLMRGFIAKAFGQAVG
ncbi:MAG TPA: serine esterase [Candidatus Limnocylindria bacterium]|nr:serine esterase [Candidatus Limnocylindria bacterium]